MGGGQPPYSWGRSRSGRRSRPGESVRSRGWKLIWSTDGPGTILLLAYLSLLPQTGLADWRVLQAPGADGTAGRKAAVSENETRHRLEVFVDGQGEVYGSFLLPPGLDRFPEDACPTFQVDRRRPINLATRPDGCRILARRVRFALGTVKDARVASPILVQLMYGNVAFIRYRLEHVGYGEAAFGLQGSKQALLEAIGPGVTVSSW